MAKPDIPITEELDFSYLLGLMRPLHNEEQFAWLPELFAIIGHDNLIQLCKYAGGETIKIPTLDSLFRSVEVMQYFYDVYIKHKKAVEDIPITLEEDVFRVRDIYNARENQTTDKQSKEV